MPWGSSRLLQNTGTSKGAFHRLAEGTLLNYLELTDCNTMLRSLYELGSLASALRSSLPFRRDGQTDAVPGCVCRQLGAPVLQTAGGGRGSAASTASTLSYYFTGKNVSEFGGRGAENLATT